MAASSIARRSAILDLLNQDGFVDVVHLHEQLGCSEATVRRDLEQLHRDGQLIRVHGGAFLDGAREKPFTLKVGENAEQKRAIGQAAAGLVDDGHAIGLLGGTTTQQVAHALATRQGLTVVTNAINIAMELADTGMRVIVTGGELRGKTYELVGPLAEPAALQLHLDLIFVGVDGLSVEGGLTTHNPIEARVDRFLMGRAAQVAVVADHSKIGKKTFAQIARLEEAHMLITDAGADRAAVRELERAGLHVVTVPDVD